MKNYLRYLKNAVGLAVGVGVLLLWIGVFMALIVGFGAVGYALGEALGWHEIGHVLMAVLFAFVGAVLAGYPWYWVASKIYNLADRILEVW